MFRYGGRAYIVTSGNPSLKTFFFCGTEHYVQKEPCAALFNEFDPVLLPNLEILRYSNSRRIP
jgi:hypothetical protein